MLSTHDYFNNLLEVVFTPVMWIRIRIPVAKNQPKLWETHIKIDKYYQNIIFLGAELLYESLCLYVCMSVFLRKYLLTQITDCRTFLAGWSEGAPDELEVGGGAGGPMAFYFPWGQPPRQYKTCTSGIVMHG